MIDSSSGWGEKTSTLAASSAATTGAGAGGKPPSGKLRASSRSLRHAVDESNVGVAHCALLTAVRGRLAAATAWPTRRLLSSGRKIEMRRPISGNSAARTAAALARMTLAALARGDAAENHDVLHVVELGIPGDRVPQVDADGLEDLRAAAGSPFGHERLHHLEALGQGHVRRGR